MKEIVNNICESFRYLPFPLMFITTTLSGTSLTLKEDIFLNKLIIGLLICTLINVSLKWFLFTPICRKFDLNYCIRPNCENDNGMPSYHVQIVSFYTLSLYIYRKNLLSLIVSFFTIFFMSWTRTCKYYKNTIYQTFVAFLFGLLQAYLQYY